MILLNGAILHDKALCLNSLQSFLAYFAVYLQISLHQHLQCSLHRI